MKRAPFDSAVPSRAAARCGLVSLVIALASVCSGTGGADQPAYIDVSYDCERGEPISVRYYTEQELAELTLGDDVLSLPQQRTASGFHYTNGRTGIRGKGDEIMLEIGRMAPIRCTAK